MMLRNLALGSAALLALSAFTLTAGAAGYPTQAQQNQQTQPQTTPTTSTTPSMPDSGTTSGASTSPATATAAATQGTVKLDAVSDPQTTLASVAIENKSGESIGTVQEVVMGSNGKPTAIKVDAGTFLGQGSKIVSIRASKLTFDQGRHVLVASLTRAQIKALHATN